VLNSDGGSADGTPHAMIQAAEQSARDFGGDADIATVRYRGISGKGSAFREIFESASALEARAVVVLDADLRSVTPEWIARLASPIVEDAADFVAPLYRRHKFDGTITNSIVYPMTHALFGGHVRQPIGGDFGFSGALAGAYARQDVWESDVARFGIDLWMTTTALAEGYRVAQAHLGAKLHDPKDPGKHLSNMLVEVVGTAFALLERHDERWLRLDRRAPAPVLYEPRQVALDPVQVDTARMWEQFRFATKELSSIYAPALPPLLWERIARIAESGELIDDETWASTIYAYALAWRRRLLPRDQLVRSLTPLYLGRTASFITTNLESSDEEAEQQIDRLASTFAALVSGFVEAWKTGART
jgi:glycosyltransferase involved in cell wall biosynthesis